MKRLQKSSHVPRNKRYRTEETRCTPNDSCTKEKNKDDLLLRKDTGENILKFLPSEDLCNVALVSERMHTLASDPRLWNRVSLSQRKVKKEGLARYFSECKFIRFKAIKLCGIVTAKDCKALLDHLKAPGNKIEEVDFKDCDLTQIPPVMLAETVMKLGKVNMSRETTTQQLLKVFTLIASSETLVLKELNLPFVDLSKISPSVLSTGISKLEKVNMNWAITTTLQMIQVFTVIGSSETLILKELNLRGVCISEVLPDVIVTGISKVKKVDISKIKNKNYPVFYGLTTEQTKHIFKKISGSETILLKELNLCEVNLSEVPPDELATGISKMATVDLSLTSLTTKQTTHIFKKISESETLIELALHGVNLLMVPPHLLATGISNLVKVDLSMNDLTTKQMIEIFRKIGVLKTLKLKELNAPYSDLSAVPAPTLATGISNLVKVNLHSARFTTEQIRHIFMKMSGSETQITKELDLSRVNLSGVPPGVLVKGMSNLVKVDISETELTAEQKLEIFKKFGELTSILTKDLNICFEHVSDIPSDVLVRVISKLGKVNRSGTVTSRTSMSNVSTISADSSHVAEVHFKAEWRKKQGIYSSANREYENMAKDMKLISSDKKAFWVHKQLLKEVSHSVVTFNITAKFKDWAKKTTGSVMEKILEFIYKGETKVEQKYVCDFIKSAEELWIL